MSEQAWDRDRIFRIKPDLLKTKDPDPQTPPERFRGRELAFLAWAHNVISGVPMQGSHFPRGSWRGSCLEQVAQKPCPGFRLCPPSLLSSLSLWGSQDTAPGATGIRQLWPTSQPR